MHAVEDGSSDLCGRWLADRPEQPPALDKLKDFVMSQPDSLRIPLASCCLRRILDKSTKARTVAAGEVHADHLGVIFSAALLYQHREGGTEQMTSSLIDTVFAAPLMVRARALIPPVLCCGGDVPLFPCIPVVSLNQLHVPFTPTRFTDCHQ